MNNAGAGGHGAYAALPVDDVEAMVRLNLLAPVRLTSAALPVMVARGRGGIVNVSSISGEQPIPFVATYAATKAFLTSLSESLHEELRGKGVAVTAVLPGFTRSEFHDRADMGRSHPRAVLDDGRGGGGRRPGRGGPGPGHLRAPVRLPAAGGPVPPCAPGPRPAGGGDGRPPHVTGDPPALRTGDVLGRQGDRIGHRFVVDWRRRGGYRRDRRLSTIVATTDSMIDVAIGT